MSSRARKIVLQKLCSDETQCKNAVKDYPKIKKALLEAAKLYEAAGTLADAFADMEEII
jgi:hypothetical protein